MLFGNIAQSSMLELGKRAALAGLASLMLLTIVACGKSADTPSTQGPASSAAPTNPVTDFAASDSPATSSSLRHLNQAAFEKINVPKQGLDFSFLVFGENQGTGPVFERVLQEMAKQTDAIFAISTGNMVQTASEPNFSSFLSMADKHLKIPLLTTLGTNDMTSQTGDQLYRQIFGRPYYAFRIGNNGIYVIDNAKPSGMDDEQFKWLTAELDRSGKLARKIVIMHKPIYDPHPGGKGGMEPAQAKRLLDLLHFHMVDISISSGMPGYFSGNWGGMRYVITGGAGAPMPQKDSLYYRHNYLLVKISPSSAVVYEQFVTLPEDKAAEPAKPKTPYYLQTPEP